VPGRDAGQTGDQRRCSLRQLAIKNSVPAPMRAWPDRRPPRPDYPTACPPGTRHRAARGASSHRAGRQRRERHAAADHLAEHGESGAIPNIACAPPSATRKSAHHFIEIKSAPHCEHTRRNAARNSALARTRFMCRRSARRSRTDPVAVARNNSSTCCELLKSSTRVCRVRSAGTTGRTRCQRSTRRSRP